MSRTTRSSGRSQGLVDHLDKRGLRQIASTTPSALHDSVQLLVGELSEGLIEALQARPCREKERQYLLSKLLPLTLGGGPRFPVSEP